MPAHKNQHFVPRCALKPFTLDGGGKAINVFNISANRAIANAPVKGQCARDYLYAKEDLAGENLLITLEGHYAHIAASLSADSALSPTDVALLKMLMIVQMRRTELAIQQMREFTSGAADIIFARAPEQKPKDTRPDRQVMWQSMRTAAELMDYVLDLKLVIFRNKTAVDFVTSDNPALLTNRFHFQKLKENKFGISNSGAILSMPLSPRLSAFGYDTGIYVLPNASGTQFIDLTNESDCTAINQLQYLSASKNIYFRQWAEASRIESEVEAVSQKRSKAGPMFIQYIPDDNARRPVLRRRDPKTGNMKKYRLATPEDEKTARSSLIFASFVFAEPSLWPSKLRFRDKPKYFYNGSAVGHVRRSEWLIGRRRRSKT